MAGLRLWVSCAIADRISNPVLWLMGEEKLWRSAVGLKSAIHGTYDGHAVPMATVGNPANSYSPGHYLFCASSRPSTASHRRKRKHNPSAGDSYLRGPKYLDWYGGRDPLLKRGDSALSESDKIVPPQLEFATGRAALRARFLGPNAPAPPPTADIRSRGWTTMDILRAGTRFIHVPPSLVTSHLPCGRRVGRAMTDDQRCMH